MSHRADASLSLAETVRVACVDAARLAYEDAGIRGLCAEGRWEAALAAMRQLDLSGLLDLPPTVPSAEARLASDS
jgi:pentatricopeptide repeat protein